MFINFRGRGRERKDTTGRKRDRGGVERERERVMWKRNTDRLPPVCTLTGNWTCNLAMCPDQEFWCMGQCSKQLSHLTRAKSFWLIYFSFFLERERKEGERETSTCHSTYPCTHWLLLVCALTRDPTCNLGILGWHSTQPGPKICQF